MLRSLAPTAAPILFRNLLGAVVSILARNGGEGLFGKQIQEYFGVKHVFLVSSGKAAICLGLKAIQEGSKRKEVVIPAYASFCLASAAARSGLSVRLCDIDPETLDLDLEKLRSIITEKTLALIPVHNYGLVCNLKAIRNFALDKGAFVIEDAAQAGGALFENRKVGAIGDIGILSLGRGKNLCALGGGVILTNHDGFASSIEESLKGFPIPRMFSSFKPFTMGLGVSLFLNPERYALPANFPFLELGANIFDPNFEIDRFPKLNAEVGHQTFSCLDGYNQIRIRNAQLLHKNLCGNNAIAIPKPSPDSKCVYLRFPILFRNRQMRERVLLQLNEKRLGASISYPTPLSQIAGFRKYVANGGDFPGAQFVSDRILTLPTHPYVKESDIQRIVSVINGLVSR